MGVERYYERYEPTFCRFSVRPPAAEAAATVAANVETAAEAHAEGATVAAAEMPMNEVAPAAEAHEGQAA